ncbi:hypothetical protein H696_05573 [Fonticula alba]|uniref:Uncharacterized protein n=1 Tax=Fonticula alba TaxID=691883 RepID=A0A058Z2U3_FONAL|nr:hypothetical protein H696_05573 [Fonticula alba]KCV67842.1 hypothetical protein H696_05573 [Fonticula alba]|eukprot:XP_009497662.1 hypothetical protein H696_05573 [Fonticula alba]
MVDIQARRPASASLPDQFLELVHQSLCAPEPEIRAPGAGLDASAASAAATRGLAQWHAHGLGFNTVAWRVAELLDEYPTGITRPCVLTEIQALILEATHSRRPAGAAASASGPASMADDRCLNADWAQAHYDPVTPVRLAPPAAGPLCSPRAFAEAIDQHMVKGLSSTFAAAALGLNLVEGFITDLIQNPSSTGGPFAAVLSDGPIPSSDPPVLLRMADPLRALLRPRLPSGLENPFFQQLRAFLTDLPPAASPPVDSELQDARPRLTANVSLRMLGPILQKRLPGRYKWPTFTLFLGPGLLPGIRRPAPGPPASDAWWSGPATDHAAAGLLAAAAAALGPGPDPTSRTALRADLPLGPGPGPISLLVEVEHVSEVKHIPAAGEWLSMLGESLRTRRRGAPDAAPTPPGPPAPHRFNGTWDRPVEETCATVSLMLCWTGKPGGPAAGPLAGARVRLLLHLWNEHAHLSQLLRPGELLYVHNPLVVDVTAYRRLGTSDPVAAYIALEHGSQSQLFLAHPPANTGHPGQAGCPETALTRAPAPPDTPFGRALHQQLLHARAVGRPAPLVDTLPAVRPPATLDALNALGPGGQYVNCAGTTFMLGPGDLRGLAPAPGAPARHLLNLSLLLELQTCVFDAGTRCFEARLRDAQGTTILLLVRAPADEHDDPPATPSGKSPAWDPLPRGLLPPGPEHLVHILRTAHPGSVLLLHRVHLPFLTATTSTMSLFADLHSAMRDLSRLPGPLATRLFQAPGALADLAAPGSGPRPVAFRIDGWLLENRSRIPGEAGASSGWDVAHLIRRVHRLCGRPVDMQHESDGFSQVLFRCAACDGLVEDLDYQYRLLAVVADIGTPVTVRPLQDYRDQEYPLGPGGQRPGRQLVMLSDAAAADLIGVPARVFASELVAGDMLQLDLLHLRRLDPVVFPLRKRRRRGPAHSTGRAHAHLHRAHWTATEQRRALADARSGALYGTVLAPQNADRVTVPVVVAVTRVGS